jgi:cyanophycinase
MPKSNANRKGKKRAGARGTSPAKSRARAVRARMTESRSPARVGPSPAPKGTLIIVGGHEDKEDEKLILRAVAEQVGSGRLVVATVASQEPNEMWETYERVFRGLGVRHVHHLDVDSREEAKSEKVLRVLDDATVVFFTGGDQLKLTSQLGDTPVYDRLREIHAGGGTIAGTSAGASVVCETMVVAGGQNGSNSIAGDLRMAPGFGLFPGVIVDQHFAERGRIGRLVAAVTQNPRILGIGIDENTAIIHQRHAFRVLGGGAVYVVDAQDLAYTNLTDESGDRTISAFHLRLHLLTMGDEFDLESREPAAGKAEELEEELLGAG